ncbi:MAG: sigma-54 interaction domain-containing protein [Desulfobulbaceae bacterium]
MKQDLSKPIGTDFSPRRREVDRLAENWKVLLDNMLEMVFLINENKIIQYMNLNAIKAFGDTRNQNCENHLCCNGDKRKNNCPVKLLTSGQKQREPIETKIGDIYVEYTSATFRGYLDEVLVMVVMRDITKRIKQQIELNEYKDNLSKVLQEKISELNETEKVQELLLQQLNSLKRRLHTKHLIDGMIGSSKQMQELRNMIDHVAKFDATILLTGESGTGKDLVADLIQKCSERKNKPFLKVNCNAINDNLLESDLFGYEKGAFTGALARQQGKFEIVDGGTIFLDEVGDISPRMQAALLRVLQNGEIIRVGGNKAFKVDVRIIAATNVDLAQKVKEGSFRLDLFYRLNIINIHIPPLRERKEDIIDLVTHFVKQFRKVFKKEIDFLPNSIINCFLSHDWPGNVRELENVIQRAVLMAKNNIISERDISIGEKTITMVSQSSDYLNQACAQVGLKPLKGILSDFEKELIFQALKKNEMNVVLTAKQLKLGKTALYAKMKLYGLANKDMKKISDYPQSSAGVNCG